MQSLAEVAVDRLLDSLSFMGAVRHSTSRFEKFARAVLVFNLVVIVWGAYVRASGSGAGCGSHWPLCNGQVIPVAPQIHTAIEYAHRFSSGLCLILSATLTIWAFRIFPKRHRARKAAGAALGFTLMEALIGAALVLFGFVANDQSAGRAVSISLHLANTLFLIASLALTVRFGSEPPGRGFSAPGRSWAFCGIILACTAVLGVTGALAALGDTLFHSSSLAAGIHEDFQAGSHFLLKLRVIHPFLAVATGLLLFGFAEICRSASESRDVSLWARAVEVAIFCQLALGGLNLILLAPTALQLLHLFMADLVWLSAVILSASFLESRSLTASGRGAAPAHPA